MKNVLFIKNNLHIFLVFVIFVPHTNKFDIHIHPLTNVPEHCIGIDKLLLLLFVMFWVEHLHISILDIKHNPFEI